MTILMLLMVTGCSNRPTRMGSVLVTEDAAKKHVHTAMASESADERRDAVEQLKVTRHVQKDFVVEAALSVAKLDPSDSVRISAIQLAVSSRRPDVARELVSILVREKGSLVPIVPVREEILRGLSTLVDDDAISIEDEEAVGSTVAQLVRLDPSRNVRIAAARLLGKFQRPEAVRILIAALSDSDFGVAYHARQSLVEMTGEDLGPRSQPWQEWFDRTDDPFANAQRSESRADGWWQRMTRSFRGDTNKPDDSTAGQ